MDGRSWTPLLAASVAFLGVGACTTVPDYWKSACAAEAVAQRFQTIAPDGVALVKPDRWRSPSLETVVHLLTAHGATWVEVPLWPEALAQIERMQALSGEPSLFQAGAGRYAITLSEFDSTACQDVLRGRRLGPDGYTKIDTGRVQSTYPPPDLSKCLVARRTGDLPARSSEHDIIERSPVEWSAPYRLEYDGERDPRSTERHRLSASRVTVVRAADDEVIWRSNTLSVMDVGSGWFPALSQCSPQTLPAIFGPPRDVPRRHPWSIDVF